MGKRVEKTAYPLDDMELYTNCPECDTEIIVEDFFKVIICPKCGRHFRPHRLFGRRKYHDNPSFRGFRPQVKVNGKRTKMSKMQHSDD